MAGREAVVGDQPGVEDWTGGRLRGMSMVTTRYSARVPTTRTP